MKSPLVLKRGEMKRLKSFQIGKHSKYKTGWYKLLEDRVMETQAQFGSPRQRVLFQLRQVEAVEKISDDFKASFGLVVRLTKNKSIELYTANREEQVAWMNSILKARNAQLAVSGKLLFRSATDSENEGFFRFEDSDSETDEDEDDGGSVDFVESGEHMMRHQNSTFVILQAFLGPERNHSICVAAPYDKDGLENTSALELKQNSICKMKAKIKKHHMDEVKEGNILHSVLHKDTDHFVLKMYDHYEDMWLRDESKSISEYIESGRSTALLREAGSTIQLGLVEGRYMPAPKLNLSILSTHTKVSDLSQKNYIVYDISVYLDSLQWSVAKRYSDFRALHDALVKDFMHNNLPLPPYFPILPPKQLYTPTTGDFVEKRRLLLEEYLKDVVSIRGMSENIHILSFLGVMSTSRNVCERKAGGVDNRPVLHISVLYDHAMYGDVILFKCRFGASRMQRTFTGSRYDHVGIVVPVPGRHMLGIIEATGEGICVYSLKSRLMAYAKEVSQALVIRRISFNRTAETQRRLSEFVEQVEGNDYSIFGILRGKDKVVDNAEFSVASPPKEKKFFCSELAAACLRAVGCISTERVSSYFWPGSFAEGGEIDSCLAEGVTIGPEISIDCRIMEVGRAVTDTL